MSFSRMVELLKEKHKEKILFIKSGAFYIAIAQDAVFLSRLLSLKTTCFKKDVCKVGVPINSLEKYLNKLDENDYGYIVYTFDKEKKLLEPIIVKNGKTHNETEVKRKCLLCRTRVDVGDEYLEALGKLYDREGK